MTHMIGTIGKSAAQLEEEAAAFARRAMFEFSPLEARFLRGRAEELMAAAQAQRTAELEAVAAAQPRPCARCRVGCTCDGSVGDFDCGHYGCMGRSRRPAPEIPRCPGVAYEQARVRAITAHQGTLHFARRRGPDVYARVLASVLRSAGLHPAE